MSLGTQAEKISWEINVNKTVGSPKHSVTKNAFLIPYGAALPAEPPTPTPAFSSVGFYWVQFAQEFR